MGMVRMDIVTVVVGGGPVASLVVLKPRDVDGDTRTLPIRIGAVEASSIGMGINTPEHGRPMTHDLLLQTINSLGATVRSVSIVGVEGTTFFAHVTLNTLAGDTVELDSRPSDAIALAVRSHAPIFATEEVLSTASSPDFATVRKAEQKQELEEFHDFVENLSPDDFSTQDGAKA